MTVQREDIEPEAASVRGMIWTYPNQVITFPVYASCDWGDCDEQATAWRWDDQHGWLPVCLAHSFQVVLS